MNHPQIDNMMKYGHPSFKELLAEAIEENRIIEDVYGEQINIGDDYYINEHDELIHANSLPQYALDHCDLNKKTR